MAPLPTPAQHHGQRPGEQHGSLRLGVPLPGLLLPESRLRSPGTIKAVIP